MIDSTFKQKLDSSGNITGIYNYCNRFCEDCPFTEVCANYKMSVARFSANENPESFTRALRESMEESRMMLEQILNNHGIDPDDLEANREEIAWQKKIDDAVDKHRLSEKTMEYFTSIKPVFDEMDIVSIPHEAMEIYLQKVVSFSSHIISKTKRALHDFYEMDPFGEDDFDVNDMNGSAKCQLIMVDDSISIWKKIISLGPTVETYITPLISLLENIRGETEMQFPDARKFVRGGFDEL